MARAGVLGWPVSHSRSPAMHEAAYRHLGLSDWSYQRLPVPPPLFPETVRALPGSRFVGVNVTIPHKEAALAIADSATPAALAIGAANSLAFASDGSIQADNTDAPGLIAALPRSPEGQTALILGAGGSARAVLWALLSAGAAQVHVWNRTPTRAREICDAIGGGEPTSAAHPADLLINCTAAGLSDQASTFNELPIGPSDLGDYGCVVDLMYRDGSGRTALLSAADAAGTKTVDGIEILVQQGAISLSAWTGLAAPIGVMLSAARELT